MKNIISTYFAILKMYKYEDDAILEKVNDLVYFIKNKLLDLTKSIKDTLPESKYEILILIAMLKELADMKIKEIDTDFDNMYFDLNLDEKENELYILNQNDKVSVNKTLYNTRLAKDNVKKSVLKGSSYALSRLSRIVKR